MRPLPSQNGWIITRFRCAAAHQGIAGRITEPLHEAPHWCWHPFGLRPLVHVAVQLVIVNVDRTGAIPARRLREFVLQEHEVHRADHALVDGEARLGRHAEHVGEHAPIPDDLCPGALIGSERRLVLDGRGRVLIANGVASMLFEP